MFPLCYCLFVLGPILNGELHRELMFNPQSAASPSLIAHHLLMSSPPSHTLTGSIFPVSCNLCTMSFGNIQALNKHILMSHYFQKGLSKDPSVVCCNHCNLQFGSAMLFVDHYIMYHSSFGGSLSQPPPLVTEQVKPTDLSMAKKAPRVGHDDRPPSAKRFKMSENGFSSSSSNGVESAPRTPVLVRENNSGFDFNLSSIYV